MTNSSVKQERQEVFSAYLPAFITLLFTIAAFSVYTATNPDKHLSTYLALLVIAPTPFVIIWVNRRFSLGLPKYLIILMCSHAVCSVDLGTTIGLYWRMRWWDTFVHCYFGFLACATLYHLYFHFQSGKPKFIEYIVMVMLVLAIAGGWEIYEFFASMVFKSDMQDVAYQLGLGINPLTDTVVDMMVATGGALVFLAGLFLFKWVTKLREKKLNASHDRTDQNDELI